MGPSSVSDLGRCRPWRSPPRRSKRNDVPFIGSIDDRRQPLAPKIKRSPLFMIISMSVINGGNFWLGVVQNLCDDDAIDAKPCHVRRRRAPQVVNVPIRYAG